jgi:tetratricopeptide (TPR) repeat protein
MFMFCRETYCMYPAAVGRWLLAVALSFSFSVSLHAQVSRFTVDSTTDTSSSTAASNYVPTVVSPAVQRSPLSLEQMGDSLRASGHYQAARKTYEQIAQPSATVLNKMGISYQMMNDLKNAMRCYKASLKLRPTNAEVLNNMATAEELLGNFSAAERDFGKALKIEPNDVRALKNLGTNLLMQGKNDKSAEAYKKALAIDPHILDDHYGPEVNEDAEGRAVGAANYTKAQSCAQAGLIDCAVTHLQRAFNEGAATVKKVSTDTNFANLRTTPAMVRLLAQEQ